MDDEEFTSVDKKISKVLREACDAPRVLFFTDEPLLIRRHGSLKHVLLVATRFYTYLIKHKGYKLYTRWPNRQLSVMAQQSNVVLSTPDAAPIMAGTEVEELLGRTKGAQKADEDDYRRVTIESPSSLVAMNIEGRLNLLIHSAQRTAALLEQEEMDGGLAARQTSTRNMDEDDGDGGESDSSGSDTEDATAVPAVLASGAGGTGADGKQRGGASADGQRGLLNIPPSRYIAITSLVDGEFADYATLKNAFMRHEEEDLLRDLAAFIKENEGQVEALCQHHYPAFTHAAQLCLAISERDAQLVGEELSGASTLVRSSVMNMKQVAANLVLSRSTRDNLARVRGLLTRARTVVEYLETVESQVQKQQLIGAVMSLRELVRLSASMAEYALGEYVLHVRMPALASEVFVHAVQQLNGWLQLQREKAYAIGQAALEWGGTVAAGTVSRRVVLAEEGSYWWLAESFLSAAIALAPFTEAEAVTKIASGAGIQKIFVELRREEYFHKYYAEGRAQQARADLFDFRFPVDGVPGQQVVESFERYAAVALGFMLIEDIVYSATSPHILSSAEILKTWDRVAAAVADRAREASRALMAEPNYADYMRRFFEVVRNLVHHAVENVKCVELSPVILSRVVETLSDNLISLWLQSACVECTELILTDTLVPLSVTSASQFDANVSRFYLNRCPVLELPIAPAYTSGTVTLPYSIFVPLIGDKVLSFLSQCYSVIVTEDSTSSVRQSELNNVDEMLLKYISVLFRTVTESLQGQLMSIGSRSLLQYAVFVTSCSAMTVVVSCMEQQFMLRWTGDYSGQDRQQLGEPRLLSSSSALFSKPIQKGIEGLMGAYRAELEERLKPTTTLAYWRRQVELRNGRTEKRKSDADEGFAACMDYAITMMPKLKSILQSAVIRSVVNTGVVQAGLLMETSIETALTSAYNEGERDFGVMRECLREFNLQCTTYIPRWQQRLKEEISDLSVTQRFPLNPQPVVSDMGLWVDRREAQYQADRANQPQLLAGIEGAGKAIGKGFQVMGKTVTATANATANVFTKKEQ